MKPTVGRIVHYQAYGTPGGEFPSVPRAAIVTGADALGPEVAKDATLTQDERYYRVHICVLNPSGMFFNLDVKYDADGKPGTWRWPPRE